MNTELRKKAKTEFEKYLFKLIDIAIFEKNMQSVRKHRDFKLITTDARRNYLLSEPNYHTITFFKYS